ncbi:hypothetical protein C3481_14335 [Microbacterium sp. Ru50]|uniref:hypothetical protein n=1 Tax=Microbacterium sp. Ru50 TaxID=2080744 RepID=UPI000CDDF3E4|nr:hypothetical protein [Microbacterium sp. Ru50]POX65732.1 hypothetical protein C3481_14335 [Microbacterium sp. Ru50]
MSFLHTTARGWAEDHSLAADVRFAQLEAVAYQRHPEIFQHFGADGAAMAHRLHANAKRSPVRGVLDVVLWAVVIGAFFAPIAGLAVLMGDRFDFHRIEAQRAMPIAGAIFTVAAVAQTILLVIWLVRGARFSWPEFSIHLVAGTMAILALGTMPGIAELDDYIGWQQWRGPVLIALGVAGLAALVMLVRFRVREPDGDGEAVPETGLSVGGIRARIAALPGDERQAIVDDRNAALAVLHERGLIDAGTLERALGCEPGTLFLLDAERRA